MKETLSKDENNWIEAEYKEKIVKITLKIFYYGRWKELQFFHLTYEEIRKLKLKPSMMMKPTTH